MNVMKQNDFVQYLNNGSFELLMQGQGVGFRLGFPYQKEFINFLIIKNISVFYFVSFLDISKLIPITNAEEDKKYLDDSFETESQLLDALGKTEWTYYHAIFRANSNMASTGGVFILNVEFGKMKAWLNEYKVDWYVWGESGAVAKYYSI